MEIEIMDLVEYMQIYHNAENEAAKFLTISAYAMKNKTSKIKSAQSTLKAIEEYKKLPEELRVELEKNKDSYLHNINEVERLCGEAGK